MKKYTLVFVNNRGERMSMGVLAEDRDQAEQQFWANVHHQPQAEIVRIVEQELSE